jgi:hypothetical protein
VLNSGSFPLHRIDGIPVLSLRRSHGFSRPAQPSVQYENVSPPLPAGRGLPRPNYLLAKEVRTGMPTFETDRSREFLRRVAARRLDHGRVPFRQAAQNGKKLTFVGRLQNDPATVQNQTFQRSMKHGPPPADLGFDRVQAIATITQIYCSR